MKLPAQSASDEGFNPPRLRSELVLRSTDDCPRDKGGMDQHDFNAFQKSFIEHSISFRQKIPTPSVLADFQSTRN
jgi:hypothetical protein